MRVSACEESSKLERPIFRELRRRLTVFIVVTIVVIRVIPVIVTIAGVAVTSVIHFIKLTPTCPLSVPPHGRHDSGPPGSWIRRPPPS